MKSSPILQIVLTLFSLSLPACSVQKEKHHKVVVTHPEAKSVTITQQYVCQIQSQRHIELRAFERGFLEAIPIKQGQQVKEGDLLFKVSPPLYQAKLDVEKAEVEIAQLELNGVKEKFEKNIVSQHEVARFDAKLARAQADLAAAESKFAAVKAPFDGVVGRLQHQRGSMIERGEVVTTLSDNSSLTVYFNVSEARYLEYMTDLKEHHQDLQIDLVLGNGSKFQHTGKIGAIVAVFNTKTGGIPFRADFPNPDRLPCHGQTGTVLVHRVVNDAIVIPQHATFENLQKRYVYVVDNQNVAHQREVVIQNEVDDLFVIKKGIDVDDKIVLEGVRHVRDGEKLEYEELQPKHVVAK